MRIKHIPTSKGFTLIEVMVVVVILGILASFIVPKILSHPELSDSHGVGYATFAHSA